MTSRPVPARTVDRDAAAPLRGRSPVLTVSGVLPAGLGDAPVPPTPGPALPVVPEPVTDGTTDRVVVAGPTVLPDRPSATLLAAQQLSEEADRRLQTPRGRDTAAADRRRRRQRALVAERRAARSWPTAG